MVKNPLANAGDIKDTGSIPGSERSPGERRGNPLQYSCLENSKDRGDWQAAVNGVTKTWTQLIQLNTHNTHSVFIKFFHDYVICCKYNKIQTLYQHLSNKHITKADIWIANKHMKKCSKSFSSVQFSRSVMSDSVVCGLQHTRPLCPSPTPGVYPN